MIRPNGYITLFDSDDRIAVAGWVDVHAQGGFVMHHSGRGWVTNNLGNVNSTLAIDRDIPQSALIQGF